MALPTNRTTSTSIADHVADHNVLHEQHNDLEGHAEATTDVHGIADTSQLATNADVAAAVAGLVDSAPATLDTLNELAAALGDDESFATTVTTALAGKAATGHDHDVDYEAAGAVATHAADTTDVHGIADTSALALTSHTHSGTYVPVPADPPTPGQILSATDDDPLTTDWIDPPEGGSGIAATLVDAKGDLIVATAADTVDRLAVGAAGRAPVADPTATPGVAWGGPLALRDITLKPTAALAETIPRTSQINTAQTLTGGTLYLVAIALPAGLVISNLAFTSGGQGAVGPTNWWFALLDSSRNLLAVTANQTTTAWAQNTLKTLAIATVASGAAASFTTTYAGLHYLGIMMTGGTIINVPANSTLTAVGGLAPILSGTSNTSQTTPPAFPFQANAITAIANVLYGYVS